MGMKSKSVHFSSNATSGGESKRMGEFDPTQAGKKNGTLSLAKMSRQGRKLYAKATDKKLKDHIAQLYRPGAHVGDGGTADALRAELKTGKPVGGKSHYLKAKERAVSLQKLIKHGNLNAKDAKIAKSILTDLENALKGN